jgi:phytol kinase
MISNDGWRGDIGTSSTANRIAGQRAALASSARTAGSPITAPRRSRTHRTIDAGRSASSPVKAAPPLSLTAAVNLIEARIGPTELRRRAWHMLPGLLPFVLVAVPHDDPTSVRFKFVISSVAGIIVAAMCYHFSKIRRRGEQRYDGIAAVVGYALPVLALILMFPAHAELALTVLTVIAFGDGSATLGGLLFRGRSLPWNSRKSWFGTVCFVAVGLPYAMAIYWAGAHFLRTVGPTVPVTLGVAFVCALAATVAGALAESMPSRMNDNLRVTLAASSALFLAQVLLVGWP